MFFPSNLPKTNKNDLLYFWVFIAFNLRRCGLTRFTKRSEVLTVLMPYFVLLVCVCFFSWDLYSLENAPTMWSCINTGQFLCFQNETLKRKEKKTLGRELNFRDNATLSGMLKWRLVFSCMKNPFLLLFFLEMDIFFTLFTLLWTLLLLKLTIKWMWDALSSQH